MFYAKINIGRTKYINIYFNLFLLQVDKMKTKINYINLNRNPTELTEFINKKISKIHLPENSVVKISIKKTKKDQYKVKANVITNTNKIEDFTVSEKVSGILISSVNSLLKKIKLQLSKAK